MTNKHISALKIIQILFLLLITVLVIIPFFWMIMTALQPDTNHVLSKPVRFPLPPSFKNFGSKSFKVVLRN